MYAFVKVNLPEFDDQMFALDLVEKKHILLAPTQELLYIGVKTLIFLAKKTSSHNFLLRFAPIWHIMHPISKRNTRVFRFLIYFPKHFSFSYLSLIMLVDLLCQFWRGAGKDPTGSGRLCFEDGLDCGGGASLSKYFIASTDVQLIHSNRSNASGCCWKI